MKRFSQLMPAGVPVEFDYPARSFTLLGCITPIEVRFGTGSQTQEIAENVTPGLWYEAESPFRKIVITSPVDQWVSFVASMGRSGWSTPPSSCVRLDFDISTVLASATFVSQWVDLGENWSDTRIVMQFYGTSSVNCLMTAQCAPDASGSSASTAPVIEGLSGAASASFASTSQHLSSARPTNRFTRLFFQNGATPQGAGARLHFGIYKKMT